MVHNFNKHNSCLRGWITLSVVIVLAITSSAVFAQSSKSIQSILNPDGSIKATASQGSFNARGYKMSLSKNGAPVFTKVSSDPDDANWDSQFTVAGVGGIVISIALNGDTMYVGGQFGTAGSAIANSIAMYNISTGKWSALDSSSDLGVRGTVYSILVSGSDVYVGGNISSAGGSPVHDIAKWNRTSGWSTLGTSPNDGVNNTVLGMAMVGGSLYVVGSFTTAGGSTNNHIARWDGTAWNAVGTGTSGGIASIYSSASYIYVGGNFTTAGGNSASNVAKWDGTNWSALGSGVNGTALAVTGYGDTLFVGGEFTQAGGNPANYIAKWNGTTWSALAGGLNNVVLYNSLVLRGSKLYAGGEFTQAGLATTKYVAVWDTVSKTWSALGAGVNANDIAVATDGTNFYFGGYFSTAGGVNAFGVAKWNGSVWSSLGGATNTVGGEVRTIALDGNKVYLGGSFNVAGSLSANNIAIWDKSSDTWSMLGTGATNGVDDDVDDIVADTINHVIYVGGDFQNAGGNPANYIAKWDGTNWTTLGSGTNNGTDGEVHALALFGTDLYVGGEFTHAGGNAANYVAKWSGTAWSALGSGVDDNVYAIAAGTSVIFFGGAFANAGGSSANNIASWNGSSWSALGTGVDAEVYALAANADTVYVGGAFSNAGGNPASHIAKWDGTNWSAFGGGLNDAVDALYRYGSKIYVGGDFTSAGLVTANHIAAYDMITHAWSSFGSGLNTTSEAIQVWGNDILVGGAFSVAGNKPSYGFARYSTTLTSVAENRLDKPSTFVLMQNYPNPFNPSTTITYQIAATGHVTLKVYNLLGQEVATLVNGVMSAGSYTAHFNAARLASGIYFYRLATNDGFSSEKKMLLLK
jgi:Rax2 C-terminal beta propeller domain/Secretion system C-terminal sorting domain